MYNLLMSGGENTWDNPTWVLPYSRFLEYTPEPIRVRFKSLSEQVIEELMRLPTLFMYEDFRCAPANFGQITAINQRNHDVTITLSLDHSVPAIPFETISKLYPYLGLNLKKWELARTHWAVKDVDLAAVLQQAGITLPSAAIPQRRPPIVFISYSWDSPEHRQWVTQFGGYLRSKGIDARLDVWHLRLGEDVGVFMESTLREADRVLVICTEHYAEKAMSRKGGVGYEHMMVTAALMQDLGTTKFIPITRQTKEKPSLPTELCTRRYIDLQDGPHYTKNLEELVRELHDANIPIPPLGSNPY